MSNKPPKSLLILRRYGIAAIGVLAAIGGVAGNLGSIVDLFDKFTSKEASVTAELVAPTVAIDGTWQAEVTYDWGLKRQERFSFKVEGNEVTGTASFLGVARGILEGKVSGDKLSFVTRTPEVSGNDTKETEHRYKGSLSAGEIRFTMQTTGGLSEHVPIEFKATRVAVSN